MPGLGTIVNVAAIIVGGTAGLCFGRFLTGNIQKSLMTVLGISTIYIALEGILSEMLLVRASAVSTVALETGGAADITYSISTSGEYMLLASLVIGTIAGEILDIDGFFCRAGEFLKVKTHNTGDERFVNAFVTATLTVAIGAMAIMGSIRDGISADHSVLFVKAILDAIIIMLMTSVMGKGCIFSAIPVGVLQGLITVSAVVIAPIFTEAALGNISLTGSVLVLLVGVNILRPGTVRVANMLPSLIVAAAWSYLPWI